MCCWKFVHSYDALTAYGTLATAVAAVVAVFFSWKAVNDQIKQSRTTLWRSLDEEFNGESRRAQRRGVAEYWIKHMTADSKMESKRDKHFESRIIHILDFFETVSFLVNQGVLDSSLAHHTFWYVISGYFHAGRTFIEASVKEDPTFYADLCGLMKKWTTDPDAKDLPTFFSAELNA